MKNLFNDVIQKTAVLMQNKDGDEYTICYPKKDDHVDFKDVDFKDIDCPYYHNCKACGTWCALFDLEYEKKQLYAIMRCQKDDLKYFKIKKVYHNSSSFG